MSRTHSQNAAREYHKKLREAIMGHRWNGGTEPQDSSRISAVYHEYQATSAKATRYGSPLRHYYADLKIKYRRIRRCQDKERLRQDPDFLNPV